MCPKHNWQPDLYDGKHGYVSAFGKDVVRLLRPEPGERILDVGCGTGDLAYEISKSGAIVVGMDASPEMVEKARNKYPGLRFFVGDAERFTYDGSFDAVFSNAALHWMKNAPQVAACIWDVLRPGGRFVAEIGGKGNVGAVVRGITEVLKEECGIDAERLNPWYFPSIGEYSGLLERQGFRVTYAVHFDRPTPMEDGERGLHHWLAAYAGSFFAPFTESEKADLFDKIAARLKPMLFEDGVWRLDYSRLRIAAVKP
jgi:Trans-aconitate methyltransferase